MLLSSTNCTSRVALIFVFVLLGCKHYDPNSQLLSDAPTSANSPTGAAQIAAYLQEQTGVNWILDHTTSPTLAIEEWQAFAAKEDLIRDIEKLIYSSKVEASKINVLLLVKDDRADENVNETPYPDIHLRTNYSDQEILNSVLAGLKRVHVKRQQTRDLAKTLVIEEDKVGLFFSPGDDEKVEQIIGGIQEAVEIRIANTRHTNVTAIRIDTKDVLSKSWIGVEYGVPYFRISLAIAPKQETRKWMLAAWKKSDRWLQLLEDMRQWLSKHINDQVARNFNLPNMPLLSYENLFKQMKASDIQKSDFQGITSLFIYYSEGQNGRLEVFGRETGMWYINP